MHLFKVYFASTADAVYVWAQDEHHAILLAMRERVEVTMLPVVRYLYSRSGDKAAAIDDDCRPSGAWRVNSSG